MKKLTKINQIKADTIEAFACPPTCNCAGFCYVGDTADRNGQQQAMQQVYIYTK